MKRATFDYRHSSLTDFSKRKEWQILTTSARLTFFD
jgi:hypothetical protein